MKRNKEPVFVFMAFEYEYVNGKKSGTGMVRIAAEKFTNPNTNELIREEWRRMGHPDIIIKKSWQTNEP